jgi:hypothetical protein
LPSGGLFSGAVDTPAISGDFSMATSGDFGMATDSPTDRDRPDEPQHVVASVYQAASAWCHDGGQATVFTAVPGRSRLPALASERGK